MSCNEPAGLSTIFEHDCPQRPLLTASEALDRLHPFNSPFSLRPTRTQYNIKYATNDTYKLYDVNNNKK